MATNTNNPNPDVTSLLQGIYYQLTQVVANGGGGGGGGGSVTAAGVNGTLAQAVQGITGGVPQPVSGTVSLGAGAAAIGSVSVTGTTAISAAALPLPSGAATSANQTPPVAAGTSAANATPIQGVTGGVPIATKTNALTPAVTGTITITAGGTAQTCFAANSIVTQGLIFNPRNATESIFVDLVNSAQNVQGGGTNGTSFEIVPGQLFLCPPSTIAVSVNAATTGHAFIAVRF